MLLILLAACDPVVVPPVARTPVDLSGDTGTIDDRVSIEEHAGLIGDDAVLQGPDVIIPPLADVMLCVAGTWTGGDVGLRGYRVQQGSIGHHFMIGRLEATQEELPDGASVDCTPSMDTQMPTYFPFLFPDSMDPDEDLVPDLPAGVAERLSDGDRWLTQAHYLNHHDRPVRVQDLLALDTVPLDAVDQWASAWINEGEGFSIAPGTTGSWVMECGLDEAVRVRYTGPHMHAYGISWQVELERATGEVSSLAELPDWQAEWQNIPKFSAVDVDLAPGDILRSTCTWTNTSDAPLEFPHEMCITFSAVYPLEDTTICKGGWQVGG